MCPIEMRKSAKPCRWDFLLGIVCVLIYNPAGAEQIGLTGDGTTIDKGVPITLPPSKGQKPTDLNFSDIILNMKKDAIFSSIDTVVEEILDTAFENAASGKNPPKLSNAALSAITKRVKYRFEEFSLRSGIKGAGSFTKDLLIGAIVDFVAEEAMNYQIEQGGSFATLRAATTFVAIKQSYIIATSKGPAGLVAGQIGLLRDIAIKDMQAMQEYMDARALQNYAALRAEMWEAYGEYVQSIYSAKTMAEQERAKQIFKDRLEEIGDNWNLYYDTIAPGAGSLNTDGNRPGDNRNSSKLSDLFDDLTLRFLYLSELNVPEIRISEGPTFTPFQWTTDKPFVPAFSGITNQPVEIVPQEWKAPDKTTDVQIMIIEDARPVEPPPDYTAQIAALKAQRDALIIASIDAEFVVSESNNRLAVLRYEDLETVNYYLGVVDAEVAELRAELANGPLSPQDAARFQSLLTYQETLEAENDRINDLIEAEELKIENARLAIQEANHSLVVNQSGLVGYGFNMTSYVPPTHNPGTPTDWTGYEYVPPPFPGQSPIYDNAYGFLAGGFGGSYNQTFARDMVPVVENGVTKFRFSENSGTGSYVLVPKNERTSDDFSYLSWGTDRAVAVEGSGAGLPYIDQVFWLYGEQTPTSVLEARTGSADFTGNVYGHYYRWPSSGASSIEHNAVTGTLSFSADFASDTITGNGRFNVASSAGNFSETFSLSGSLSDDNTSNVRDVSGTEGGLSYGISSAANIVAALSGPAGSGHMAGSFYGPDGLEAGGSISYFLGDRESAIAGVFTASGSVVPEMMTVYVADTRQGTFSSLIPRTIAEVHIGNSVIDALNGNPISTVTNEGPSASGIINDLDTISFTTELGGVSYEYTQWGEWSGYRFSGGAERTGGNSKGFWATGTTETSSAVIESKSGSATFTGEVVGEVSTRDSTRTANGDISLTANFETDNITGSWSVGGTSFTNVPVVANISDDGDFSGETSFSGGLSGIAGGFFGPDAEEVAGSVWAGADGTSIPWTGNTYEAFSGVFRAGQ